MLSLRSGFLNLLQFIATLQKREISYKYQIIFGICSMIFYLQPYTSWLAEAYYIDSIFRLKISAGWICCILVILANHCQNEFIQEYILPTFWYFCIIYCLPLVSTFSLLITNFSVFWLINSIFCNLALSLITTWGTFVVLNILGAIFGYLLYFIISDHPTITIFKNDENLVIYNYILSIIICYVLIYTKERNARLISRIKDKLSVINSQLHNKVVRKTKYLKSSLKAKDVFLNNISHEMRAPMQGIYGISQELKDNWDHLTNEQKHQYIQLIVQSSERMIGLFCNLLDLGKLNANQMSMNFEKYDLQNLIQEVVTDLIPLSLSKNIPVVFKQNPNINSVTKLDKIRIAQVVRNLISNAIKYSTDGVVDVSIDYSQENTKNGKNTLIVQVKDSGIGIPEKELNIIFLPFVQSSKTKNNAGGTGLGLSICAEIVNLHSGKIWACNNSDKGSSFFFTIPIENDQTESKNNINYTIIKQINDLGIIMILDDDYLSIESGKIILSSIGFNVLSAMNTEECLKKLDTNQVAILFLDMMMIDMSGLEFLKLLRQNKKYDHIKVILVSGAYDVKEIQEAMSLGAIFYFTKPYNKSQILDGINNLAKELIQ